MAQFANIPFLLQQFLRRRFQQIMNSLNLWNEECCNARTDNQFGVLMGIFRKSSVIQSYSMCG